MKRSIAISVASVLSASALVSAYIVHRSHVSAAQRSDVSSTQVSQAKQLWHCGMHPQVIQDHSGICPICHMPLTPIVEAMTALANRLSITIDPTVVQNMGVRTALVTRGPLDVVIRTVGMLNVPEPSLHEISLRVGGWIVKLYANTEGMHVHKGDVLFDLYSPDLQVASEELISAVSSRKALDPSASDAIKKNADDLVASARRKLVLFDVADQDIDAILASGDSPKTIPFRSPADGAIVEDTVVDGSAVTAGTKLMRIEGHSKLWLDADVYERQLQLVSLGQTIEATFDAIPGEQFTGTVSFIYPHIDHMTRKETVRAILDNADAQLRPGMYGTVNIISHAVPDAILVPSEAVIDTGTRKLVFVVLSEGHFQPRDVKTGISGENDMVQVLTGLNPGETVVTSGQFLMDVESRTAEAIEKLRQGASGPDGLMHDAK